MQHLSVVELARWLASDEPPCVLDVREPWELAIASMPGSLTIPIGEITRRLVEIPRDRAVVCLCHHGMRSMQVALFLDHNGYQTVYNVDGGIDAWAREVDPNCPVY
ncbi:MAG: rhodanese-like domain-containing protein [Burkholderiaceae bacterium]